MNKKYYISTAIAYASAKPHIGNTYEIVLADALARFKRLQGYDVYFQTGTDEHGQKIENKSKEAGLTPQEYVDKMSCEIKNIWDVMNTTYDAFVRTSDPVHKEIVSKIFKKLYDKGDIYKGEYSGLYCTPCESFWTNSQLIDGKCPDCGREVTETKEEAYFFKMSNYADWLINYINDNPNFIQPQSRKNEMVNNFLKPGLEDLCVSRSSFKWGVPVSFDENHVIYVWIDALSNYISFLGYDPEDKPSEQFKKYWPCDLHLIGKDILRFHTIYWPIILKALDIEMPKKIFGHPWMLFGEDKMSKSKGNIVYADDLVKEFGVDAVRFYMLHEMPFAQDGTFTKELLIESINSNLANTLGNLVNRTIAMVNKYFDGTVANKKIDIEKDKDFYNVINNAKEKVIEKMDNIRVADAIDEIFEIFRRSNKHIDENEPWILAKDENSKERLETVLFNLLFAIREGAILLQAFMPDTSDKIFKFLGLEPTDLNNNTEINSFTVAESEVLFERIQ